MSKPKRNQKPRKLTTKERCRWARYVAALKRDLPAAYPVEVRTERIHKELSGDADWVRDGKRRFFVVRISAFATYNERVETLIHEYAHCLAWSHRHDAIPCDGHDESWGVWYSKVYRAIEDCYAKMPEELKD